MAATRPNILILNGPNLEAGSAGFKSLGAIALACEEHAAELGMEIDFRQSNHEGEMITILQDAQDACAGVVLNAGAYAHTSVALHDAVAATGLPVVEVRMSNVYKRESFRHHSYVAPAAQGVLCGFGGHGYILALDALRNLLDDETL